MFAVHLRRIPFACAVLALAVACGGGDGGGSTLPLGGTAVVETTELSGAAVGPKTALAITVLRVRIGTQAELEQGGFVLDPEEQKTTPYYVDVRYENRGTAAIDQQIHVSMEDQDGNLISATTIIELGGAPYEPCPKMEAGKLGPGETVEGCTFFLVPEGRAPSKVSFLPYDPEKETEFVYWAVE